MVAVQAASAAGAADRMRKVMSMKAVKVLEATCAVSLALMVFSPLAAAQRPPPGAGAMPGGPPAGSFRGGSPHRGGPPPGAWGPRTNVIVGVSGPGIWWGSGAWRGGWWGPGWWGPGVWPGGWWGTGAWAGPWWGPGPWVPPASAAVVVAPPAPVFVERSPPAEPPAQVWWYWCAESRAYYPYVKECPAGWQRVAPQTVVPADMAR
jgi:hypothetical protein